jgi:hypothetical protein
MVKVLASGISSSEAPGRLQPIAEKLNETGTPVSDWVHLGEIAVIPALAAELSNPTWCAVACRRPEAPI